MGQKLVFPAFIALLAFTTTVTFILEDSEDETFPLSLEADEDGNILIDDMLFKITRNGIRFFRWPFGKIFYKISADFNSTQVQNIELAMHNIESVSCVRFCKANALTPFYVNITGDGVGCFAAVGFQMNVQRLNLGLGQAHCSNIANIIHELLHVLGFRHQHCNYNRDDYVDIFWENIQEDKKVFFRKFSFWEITDFGLPYDYGSLLHYARRGFSKNGLPTMLPKNTSIEIGQRRNMSELDIEKINRMYKSCQWPF